MAHYTSAVCEVSYDTDYYDDNYYTPYRISFLLPRNGTFDYRTENISQGDVPNIRYLPSLAYYEYLHSQWDIRDAVCKHQAPGYAGSGNNQFPRSKSWHGPLKSATQNDSRSMPIMRRERAWSGFHADEEDLNDEQVDEIQEKLEWSDALNKWIPDSKLQTRPYMTFIGNPPVIEKVISSMKEAQDEEANTICERYEIHMAHSTSKGFKAPFSRDRNKLQRNNEKRDAVRKRSEELAVERRARKAYSSPLYTSMAERKQKFRMQNSRLPQSTPVSPDPRKKQITAVPPLPLWDKPKETVEIQENTSAKGKREISIKLKSPKLEEGTPLIPVSSTDQDTADGKSAESKRVTFRHSDDEESQNSRASTPHSTESKNEDELSGDLEQIPKPESPAKVQQPTQPDTLQASTAKSQPVLSNSSNLGKTKLPATVSNKTVSEPSKRQKGRGGNFRSSSQQTKKSVVPLMSPKVEKTPKKKASKPVFKEYKGVFKPKRQVIEVSSTLLPPSLPIPKEEEITQRITKKMFKPLHERRRVVDLHHPSIVRLGEDTADDLGPVISPTKISSWIYEDEDSSQGTSPEVEDTAELNPEEVKQKSFGELLANLNPALIEKTDQEQLKQIRKASHTRFIQASLHKTTQKPSKDRSYEDELRRAELAEERRKRQLDMLEKLRSKRAMLQEEEDANVSPHFEDYGFLSKYCIFSKGHMEMYRHAFDAVDDEGKGWLSGPDVMIALRGVNSKLTEAEEEYLNRILELTGYRIANGADFKLFSVLAALSQRITSLDSWMKNIIGTMDFKTLEMKMFMCKTLWECNVDYDVNKISIDQLCVELRAGGVSKEHEMEVREKLGHIEALDLLDFLTYVPLFIMIHQSVISNPLDDSREK